MLADHSVVGQRHGVVVGVGACAQGHQHAQAACWTPAAVWPRGVPGYLHAHRLSLQDKREWEHQQAAPVARVRTSDDHSRGGLHAGCAHWMRLQLRGAMGQRADLSECRLAPPGCGCRTRSACSGHASRSQAGVHALQLQGVSGAPSDKVALCKVGLHGRPLLSAVLPRRRAPAGGGGRTSGTAWMPTSLVFRIVLALTVPEEAFRICASPGGPQPSVLASRRPSRAGRLPACHAAAPVVRNAACTTGGV